jgi:hypothetical protein
MLYYDRKAQGMVIYADETPPNSVMLRYISPAEDAEERYAQMIEKCISKKDVLRNTIQRTTPDRLEAKYLSDESGKRKPLTITTGNGGWAVRLFFSRLLGIFQRELPEGPFVDRELWQGGGHEKVTATKSRADEQDAQ